ncbi:MAG: hypothetical protein JSR33_10055, partial [Proteobacteria bacterium]|nr:hypothetical protein [Pseudomonadota bacterium]
MNNQKIKKNSLGSAKLRVMIAAVSVVGLATAGVIGWHVSVKRSHMQSSVDVSQAPDIESIPGAGNPGMEYAKQQDIQNAANAQKARE